LPSDYEQLPKPLELCTTVEQIQVRTFHLTTGNWGQFERLPKLVKRLPQTCFVVSIRNSLLQQHFSKIQQDNRSSLAFVFFFFKKKTTKQNKTKTHTHPHPTQKHTNVFKPVETPRSKRQCRLLIASFQERTQTILQIDLAKPERATFCPIGKMLEHDQAKTAMWNENGLLQGKGRKTKQRENKIKNLPPIAPDELCFRLLQPLQQPKQFQFRKNNQ
jgi:hypothetical protein